MQSKTRASKLRTLFPFIVFAIIAQMASPLVQAYDIRLIEKFSVQHSSSDQAMQYPWVVLLNLEGSADPLHLHLSRAELFDSDQVLGADSPRIDVYTGFIDGIPDSWVRITITGNTLFGLIDTGTSRFEVTTLPSMLKETSSKVVKGYGLRRHKGYRHGVVNALASGKSFTRVLSIGAVVDHLYDDKYFGHGLAHAISTINGVDGIFRQELGLAVKLDVALYVENQSFSSLPGASPSQLHSFRDFRRHTPELQTDLALIHLFSGSELPDHQYAGIGYAYIGSVCQNNGFDISVSAPYYIGIELAAHEIAHNLGAFHDDDTQACKDQTSGLMHSILDGGTQMSTCSVDQIEAVLLQTSCYAEVHDGSIRLEQSGSGVVVAHVGSASTFNTVISPQVTFTFDAVMVSAPEYCHSLGNDTVNCILPAITPNEAYQFAIEFEPSGNNIVVAEYLEGGVFDADLSNNVSEVTLIEGSLPAAVTQCVDEDGDGYGWDGTASCVPVPNALPLSTAPDFLNRTTGGKIHLTDERWSSNDIVDRIIECHAYFYDSVHNKYTEDQSSYTRYRHFLDQGSQSQNDQSAGTVEVAHFVRGSAQDNAASSIDYRPWTIDQGYYSGPATFSRSSYLQIVSAGDGFDNAIRSYSSDLSFDLCTSFPDVSTPFVPTGSTKHYQNCIDTPPKNDGWGWDGADSCRIITPSTETLTVNPSVVVPWVTAMITLDGDINSDEWSAASTHDISGTALSLPVAIAGIRSERGTDSWAIMHDSDYIYLAVTVPDLTPIKDSMLYQHDDSIELFIDGGNQRSRLYDNDDSHFIFRQTGEVSGNFVPGTRVGHVRHYDSTTRQYVYEIQISKTSLQLNHGEFGFDLQVNNDQDGSERDSKWGWSGTTGANTHWYELVTVGNACFDTGPLSERCSMEVTPVTEADTCIDTGVIGDGWGWDGAMSCRMPPTLLSAVCVESGVIGDGWGWNGVNSCRL